MKILQILYCLTSGGAERLVLDLSNELSKNNEVHLLTILDDTIDNNGFYKSLLSEEIHYYNAKETRGLTLSKFYKIAKIIKKVKPDIVHFHGQGIFYYCLPSILLLRKPKYVETLHNSADVLFNNWYSIIFKAVLKMDLVKMVTISGANKLMFEKVCHINTSTLIYNGRSAAIASPKIEEVKKEINALKNNENDIVFINVGRCHRQKNQKMLVTAFNKLHEKGIGYVLLILGDSFDSEKGMEMQAIANPNIHFLGTRLNIIDYYLCADAFCLSSIYEGMPISLIEAYACECVPICTPTSGSSDLIKDGVNGFLSEDFSEASYIASIEKYIAHKDEFNTGILKKTYDDNFSMEKCTASYSELYEKMLKGFMVVGYAVLSAFI
jgi:glycosyltransferase involved in cell wall biosynthesis